MTHSVVIHAMMMSWVPERRSGKPTCDFLIYIDHRGPLCMAKVVGEAHLEADDNHVTEALTFEVEALVLIESMDC